MSKEDLFSVDAEPALHADRPFQPDPAERRAARIDAEQDELARLRDSVNNEPFQPESARTLYPELDAKARRVTPFSTLLITLAAGALGGLVAIPATFLAPQAGWGGILYLIGYGPTIEEMFKQLGMFYLLERKPHLVSRSWQFAVSAVMGGLVFATIENLVYGHLYLSELPPEELDAVMAFRWVVCTALHVACTLISSLGLRHAWKRSRAEGAPFNVRYAFLYFFAAILVHGGYNLAMFFLFD